MTLGEVMRELLPLAIASPLPSSRFSLHIFKSPAESFEFTARVFES
jgi:hypothetical protein